MAGGIHRRAGVVLPCGAVHRITASLPVPLPPRPSAERFAGLEQSELVSFVDAGGNLLVAADAEEGAGVSGATRDLAAAFGVDYDAGKARVIDHHAVHASDSGSHTRFSTGAYFPSAHLVGAKLAAPGAPALVYEGTGMSVSPTNILATRVLTATATGYSAVPGEALNGFPHSTGSDTVLVAAVQARNNARAVFTGSSWMLSDAAFLAGAAKAKKGLGLASAAGSANALFSDAIVQWACQEAGVLRAANLRHSHADGSPAEYQLHDDADKPDLPLSMFPQPEVARNSRVYRIKDDVVFAVDLQLYNASTGAWQPYAAPDVQLEFVMLDPYVRMPLADDGRGTFSARFTVPDVYGIYHFRVQYRRPGLTVISLKDQVSVRPFRHNEYERFIGAAYPYYTTAFTMMAAVFVFAFMFLFSAGGAPGGAKAVAAAGAAAAGAAAAGKPAASAAK